MKVRALIRVQSGTLTPEIRWRHYAENLLAPLCRKRDGSMMPKVHNLNAKLMVARRLPPWAAGVQTGLQLP